MCAFFCVFVRPVKRRELVLMLDRGYAAMQSKGRWGEID